MFKPSLSTLKNNWQPLLLVVLVILFWYPILFNQSFFYDDWDFINTFKSGGFSFAYLFQPHNEHLMPIFKLGFYLLHRGFGINITAAMLLSLFLHVVNTLLFYTLLKTIFPGRRYLPFITTLLFSLSAVYFEVLHWFVVSNTALSLCFLMLTLIFLGRAYGLSLFFSFLAPMNFSLGLLSIFFITLYYFGIFRPTVKTKRLLKSLAANWKADGKILMPYYAVWLAYLVIYYFLVYVPQTSAAAASNFALNFSLTKAAQFISIGFLGTISKCCALNILSPAPALFLGIFLLLNFFFLVYLLFLHFILNPLRQRTPLIKNRGVAIFALGGMLLSYAALSFARSFVTADALLNWGRYHYFPYFFLCIFAGSILPQLFQILSKIFEPRRLAIFATVILVIYLAIQLISIQSRAFSPLWLEGKKNQSEKIVS